MKYLLNILIIISVMDVFAAIKPITGIVLDAETKEPLPFTNIMVEGKNKGTVSNGEGHFVLDNEGIGANDLIIFSYVGYETLKIRAAELNEMATIHLHPANISLGAVNVSSKSLSVEEILKLVRKNYKKNYPEPSHKQNIFFHKYEKTRFPETNQITLKNSDFVGLDKKTFYEIMESMPREFTEYQDALIELYSFEDKHKIVPVKGISLEEGSNQALFEEMENKLGGLFEDIEKSNKDKKTYYQIRSGILRHKFKKNKSGESVWKEYKEDKVNYPVETDEVKSSIAFLLKDYSRPDSKNWEFINESDKYYYTKDEITVLNNELVYAISFKPKRRGLFEGTMYVSTTSYAVLQLDFAFASGKRSERFQALGFGHSMNYKKGRIIFEKGQSGYFVKYIYARQHEFASINRNLSIKKKQKRFLTDKELNEAKMEVKTSFDMKSDWEILVLDRKEIHQQHFEQVQQPSMMKFKKEYAYSPEMWNNRTIIAPTSELKKYKRK